MRALLLALLLLGCDDESETDEETEKMLDQAQEGSKFRAMTDECMQIDCSDYHLASLDAGNELDEKRAFDFIHAIHCVRYSHRFDKRSEMDLSGGKREVQKVVQKKEAGKAATGGPIKDWTEVNMGKLSDVEKFTMNCLIRKIATAGPDALLTELAHQCAKDAHIGRDERSVRKMTELFNECIASNEADGEAPIGGGGTAVDVAAGRTGASSANTGRVGADLTVNAAEIKPETNANNMDPTKMMTTWFEESFMSRELAVKMVESLPSAEEQRALLEDLQKVFVEFRVALKFLVRDTLRLAAEQVVRDEAGRVKSGKATTVNAADGRLADGGFLEVDPRVLDLATLLEGAPVPVEALDLGTLLDLSVDAGGEVHATHRQPRRVVPVEKEDAGAYWLGG